LEVGTDIQAPDRFHSRSRIVSVINAKGGVGKTTLTYHLAMALGLWHKAKVLLLDMDFQCNLTWLFCREDKLYYHLDSHRSETLFQFFWGFDPVKAARQDVTPWLVGTDLCDRVYLLPSHHHVIRLDSMMSRWVPAANRYRVLLDLLRANESLSDFDYILVDCPPGLTRLTLNALVASDCYLVPLGLDLLSVNGLLLTQKAFREYLQEVEKQAFSFFLVHHPELLGVLFPRVRYTPDEVPQEIFSEVERRARILFQEKVFEHHIRDDDAVLRAVAMKRPFFTLTSALDNPLVQDFRAVTDEFIARVEQLKASDPTSSIGPEMVDGSSSQDSQNIPEGAHEELA